jgi:hypothetical protein
MNLNKRLDMGQKGRKWTVDNYSTEVIGSKLENILDNMPNIDYDFEWENKNSNDKNLEDLLDDGKKIAILMPQSAGDVLWINSLIENVKKLYPNYDIYIFTKNQYFDYIEDNPSVHKVLPFSPELENLLLLEGYENHKGYFDIAFLPNVGTQHKLAYPHNGIDKTQFELYEN